MGNSKEFNEFINHLMANKGTCCYAPASRYCKAGQQLKDAYSKEFGRGHHELTSYKKQQAHKG